MPIHPEWNGTIREIHQAMLLREEEEAHMRHDLFLRARRGDPVAITRLRRLYGLTELVLDGRVMIRGGEMVGAR